MLRLIIAVDRIVENSGSSISFLIGRLTDGCDRRCDKLAPGFIIIADQSDFRNSPGMSAYSTTALAS